MVLGLAILSFFGFGLKPAGLPIDVMFMIMAVVAATAAMQTAGGLDYMIKIATKSYVVIPNTLRLLRQQ